MTTVVIDGGQIDLLISAALVIACSLAWCLGFSAHDGAAK